MNNRQIYAIRAGLASDLRSDSGFQFSDVAKLFRVSKDEARKLVARGDRLRAKITPGVQKALA